MRLKFDLQFFGGGGGGSATQYRKRDPEPQELQDLRLNLYNKIMPGIQSFDPNSWAKAQEISDNAMGKMNGLIDQMPGTLTQGNRFLEGLEGVLTTGNIPTGVTDKLNAGVDKSLQSSMGNMLNGLANRGVVNSSITSQGVNNLSQAAADAYNRNYLNAFNSVINGYAQGLQGAQSNAGTLMQGVNALGSIPGQAYEGATAPLMPGFNMWKAWQNSYDNREDFDTVVKQGK